MYQIGLNFEIFYYFTLSLLYNTNFIMIFKVMIILAKILFKVIRKKFKKKLALASKYPTLKKDTIRNPHISKKIKQTSKRS